MIAACASHSYILIDDDYDDWDLKAIDEACAEADRNSKDNFAAGNAFGSLSSSSFHTPEKTCNQAEVGSSRKHYNSSSSGEPVMNQPGRRIIKPACCKRSPYMDYNERKTYHCKPKVIGYIPLFFCM